jgi:DNA replication protein DnaC
MANASSLPVLLKELRLQAFTKHWESLAQQAQDKGWSAQHYLAALCEQEVAERYHRRVLRFNREAQLPPGKSLSSFDFKALSSIKSTQIESLTQQTWVQQAENVLLFGPSGVGKTHIAAAIGYALIEKGVRVKFYPSTALVQALQKARGELGLTEALTRLDKYAVLILDDIGYVKRNEMETQVLFELIAHRYESGSLIITSNQPFSQWDQIFNDNMMTVATIDRLVHHATVIECKAESYRKKQSMKKRSA